MKTGFPERRRGEERTRLLALRAQMKTGVADSPAWRFTSRAAQDDKCMLALGRTHRRSSWFGFVFSSVQYSTQKQAFLSFTTEGKNNANELKIRLGKI